MAVLGALLLADALCCIATLFQLHHVVETMRFMDYVQDFTDDFGNALTRRVQKRMEKAYPNIEKNAVLHTPAKEKKVISLQRAAAFIR